METDKPNAFGVDGGVLVRMRDGVSHNDHPLSRSISQCQHLSLNFQKPALVEGFGYSFVLASLMSASGVGKRAVFGGFSAIPPSRWIRFVAAYAASSATPHTRIMFT